MVNYKISKFRRYFPAVISVFFLQFILMFLNLVANIGCVHPPVTWECNFWILILFIYALWPLLGIFLVNRFIKNLKKSFVIVFTILVVEELLVRIIGISELGLYNNFITLVNTISRYVFGILPENLPPLIRALTHFY